MSSSISLFLTQASSCSWIGPSPHIFFFGPRLHEWLGIGPGPIYCSLGPGLLNVMEWPRPTFLGLGPGSFMYRDLPRSTSLLLRAIASSGIGTGLGPHLFFGPRLFQGRRGPGHHLFLFLFFSFFLGLGLFRNRDSPQPTSLLLWAQTT